jgi:N-acetylglucosaminyl-diphospho-decaprenol L-rhamnosyltransferase
LKPSIQNNSYREEAHDDSALALPFFFVHFNSPEACGRSVQRVLQTCGVPLQITVVDNASSEENFRSLIRIVPGHVEVIRLDQNRGWGGGLNVLLRRWLKQEGSPFCFVAPHDALPEGDCLNLLLGAIAQDTSIGIVSAEPEAERCVVPAYSPIRGPHFKVDEKDGSVGVRWAHYPNGTLLLFRRQCLNEIGVFDERYFTYGEEYEIGLRCRKLGWKVAIVRGAKVINPGRGSPGHLQHYLLARNSLIMAREYGGRAAALVRLCLMLANTARLGLHPNFGFERRCWVLARMWGMWDYLRKRYGPPPTILFRPLGAWEPDMNHESR